MVEKGTTMAIGSWERIHVAIGYAAVMYYIATRFYFSEEDLGDTVFGVVPMWLAILVGCHVGGKVIERFTDYAKEPVQGAVFITGCDSGMGEVTALQLAKKGYTVFAGCYSEKSKASLKTQCDEQGIAEGSLVYVPCDVTKEAAINKAVEQVTKALQGSEHGLVGVLNCCGLGYTGPVEYMPMKHYRACFDVNYFGYINVTQAFLPLLREAQSKPGSRRGRVVFIGTGGGVASPSPALLSAYMGSKWAGEAFIRVLRLEMQMQKLRIDCCMLNPGVVKPTALQAGGMALMDRMWSEMPKAAKPEYWWICERFIEYNNNDPGTHKSVVAETMEHIMELGRLTMSYKVGPDSKAAPIAGLLPWKVQEWLVKKATFKFDQWEPK